MVFNGEREQRQSVLKQIRVARNLNNNQSYCDHFDFIFRSNLCVYVHKVLILAGLFVQHLSLLIFKTLLCLKYPQFTLFNVHQKRIQITYYGQSAVIMFLKVFFSSRCDFFYRQRIFKYERHTSFCQ